jgi:predicted alpha/beta superfamily hydrolase
MEFLGKINPLFLVNFILCVIQMGIANKEERTTFWGHSLKKHAILYIILAFSEIFSHFLSESSFNHLSHYSFHSFHMLYKITNLH